MSLNIECPHCASCTNTFLGSFCSAVLTTKAATYQCDQCLNLFDIPPPLLTTDNNNENRILVTIYAYDYLMNLVPVDSYWTDPNDFRLPNPQTTAPATTGVLANNFDLITFLFTLVFSILLTMLGIGFVVSGMFRVG